ncbi:hypothetical protein [Roseomonas sp. AR75]|nr:hypothetical protein [Roseomonas sp. AR75]
MPALRPIRTSRRPRPTPCTVQRFLDVVHKLLTAAAALAMLIRVLLG